MGIKWRFESEGELKSSDNMQWFVIAAFAVLVLVGTLLLVSLKLGAEVVVWLR